MGFFVADDTPVIWRGPMLHKALEQFLVDAYWGEPDFLLIDMPPGTGDVTLSLGQYLTKTEVFVVTTPQAAAQRVAQRSAYAARKLKLAVRGVIENMSWFTGDDGTRYELFGAGGGRQLADDLGVPLLGQVPLVPAPPRGRGRGRPDRGGRPRRRGRRGLRRAGRHHRRARSRPRLPTRTHGPLSSRSVGPPIRGAAGRPVRRAVERLDRPPGRGQSHSPRVRGMPLAPASVGTTPSTWCTAIPPSSNPIAEPAM